MKDKWSVELSRLMGQHGLCVKFRDRSWISDKAEQHPKAAGSEKAGYAAGLADNMFIGSNLRGRQSLAALFEVKTGSGSSYERFVYEGWTHDQRVCAVACAWSGIPYYLFLVMGVRIGGRDYPRRAWIIKPLMMLDMESDPIYKGRKSLSYKTAVSVWADYELTWSKGQWTIPLNHSVRRELNLN